MVRMLVRASSADALIPSLWLAHHAKQVIQKKLLETRAANPRYYPATLGLARVEVGVVVATANRVVYGAAVAGTVNL